MDHFYGNLLNANRLKTPAPTRNDIPSKKLFPYGLKTGTVKASECPLT